MNPMILALSLAGDERIPHGSLQLLGALEHHNPEAAAIASDMVLNNGMNLLESMFYTAWADREGTPLMLRVSIARAVIESAVVSQGARRVAGELLDHLNRPPRGVENVLKMASP